METWGQGGAGEAAAKLPDTFISLLQVTQTDMSLGSGTGVIRAIVAKGQSSVASCNWPGSGPSPSREENPENQEEKGQGWPCFQCKLRNMCVQVSVNVYGYVSARVPRTYMGWCESVCTLVQESMCACPCASGPLLPCTFKQVCSCAPCV